MPDQPPTETVDAELPEYLQGLVPPVTVNEAMTHAEQHGAPAEALDFIESLPAAAFTTAEGMRNAFSSVHDGEFPAADPDGVLVGQDET